MESWPKLKLGQEGVDTNIVKNHSSEVLSGHHTMHMNVDQNRK